MHAHVDMDADVHVHVHDCARMHVDVICMFM